MYISLLDTSVIVKEAHQLVNQLEANSGFASVSAIVADFLVLREQIKGTKYNVVSEEATTRKPYVEVKNATFHAGPREEARAMCAVRTQEVNATANATITRRLHGVVTSRELRSSIQRLEVIIYGQMQQLWQSLDAVRAQLVNAGHANVRYLDAPDRRTVSFRYKPDVG
ncbi:hypothetical protein EVAR_15729_1 [Eumeta japonica]|uniref:Uncharacterized protein n=1 Tax=Eumeta variegata TaxID=151549 RepID=A0A4C1UAX1_EUMVA|nr:hypothetical protein EVAR_15729_1 [Eumeta japonica]